MQLFDNKLVNPLFIMREPIHALSVDIYRCWLTERTLPSGSLNQAT